MELIWTGKKNSSVLHIIPVSAQISWHEVFICLLKKECRAWKKFDLSLVEHDNTSTQFTGKPLTHNAAISYSVYKGKCDFMNNCI